MTKLPKHVAFAVGSALSVLGLSAQADAGEEMKKWFIDSTEKNHMAETLVIAPGYRLLIEGKSVPVVGMQECPPAAGMRVWFFGGDPHGAAGCIVIQKDAATVEAQFVLGGKTVSETWAVERRIPDHTLLRRPNGDYLAQAN